jgi:gliding motility-associated-like protein
MKSKFLFLILVVLGLFHYQTNAQLIVSNTLTPTQLAQLISGLGVQISNPVIHCGVNGYGKYNATSSNLNITEGLLLTTGKISNAVGPNDSTNTTWYFGNKTTANTYTLLNGYTGRTTYEYCEFEFDIIPQGDTIKFDFVFASDEYEEWVGSQYNDVFGFFISGPGITGDPGAGIYHNIALLPNSNTAVTINNVNQNSNTQYYQNNNNGTSVEYDGFTRGLKAISKVTPCQSYHLKLVVADVSDKLWDSGVFIEKISSNNILLLSQTAGGIPNMVEGCNNGQVLFKRPIATTSPLTINYWLGGTAINGTDYPLIGSSPNPLNPKTIIIPANQTTATLNINPTADGLNEGTEYLTVYLGNPLCSNQIMDSLRFYIQDSLFTTITPVIDSICIGQNVQFNAVGGGSAFNWLPATALNNPSIRNPIATPSTTTIYTLTTTASNCSMSRYSKINVSNINLSVAPTNITCNGANNGSVNLTVTNGFAPYTYSWSGPSSYSSNTQNISSLAPGTYSVIVTGKKGCSKTTTVTITQPSVVTATVASATYNGGFNIACYGGNSGSTSSSVAGGTAPYTYTWSSAPIQTTANASNLTAGNYTLTVKDANNCVLTKTITLTQPNNFTTSIGAQQNVACFNDATGSVTLTTNGGTSPYTYTWNTTPVQSNPVATNLSAGNYTATIKDANNCSHTQTVSITQPSAALNANISSQINVACHGNSTGSASVTVIGGTTPYAYSWNTTPIQTSAQATSLPAGSYAVTITDAKNCTTSAAVNITEPATNVSALISSQTNVSCFGFNNGSATVLASGGVPAYAYSWNSVPSQTTATAANLPAGTYNVMVKDANNCSYSIQTIITQPTASLNAIVSSQSNVLCYNQKTGSATIVANGGTSPYSYSWSTTPIQTSATATNLGAGIYTVTVKDDNACTITKTVSISQPTSAVTASISSHNNVLCFGASSATAAVVATGGVGVYTYNWSSIPTQTTSTATNLAAGNYTVTVRDANNCLALASVNISQPTAALNASITSVLNVKCKTNATGAATVVASGGSGSYSYLWNSSPAQTTSVANALIAGNYTVTVSDNNGCIVPVTKTITITEPAAILNATSSSPLFNGNHISCFGGNNGSINLSPTGGTTAYSFSWTGPSGYTSTSEDINTLIAGTYTVLITDANACSKIYTTTLTQPTLLSLSNTVTPATCPSFNDGAITLVASGGTTAYNYSWSGPSSFIATTASISGLVAGNYSLTVTDANGCIKSSVYTVTQPGAIVITNTVSSFTGGKNISCYGYNDGAIGSVNVTGGTPIYTYLWTGPSSYTSTTANISGLYAGNYQLVVTDNAGCVANKLITLSQPNAITNTLTPSVFAGNYNINCFGTSTGSLTSLSNGGTPAYTYSWSGPSTYSATTQNINGLFAGTYTLTVTDVNTCKGTNTITITQPNALVTGITSPTVAGGYNITCNGLSNGQINLTNTGGTPNYSYVWSGPSSYTSTTQNPNNIIAGTYSVVLTDANGCVTSNSISLTQPNTLVAAAISPTVNGAYNITCYGNNNGAINLNVSGGTSAFTYAWTGTGAYTGSSQNPSGLIAGTYQVLVTDANNCTATQSIALTQPTILTSSVSSPTFIGNNNISCNGLLDGAINLSVNGGTSAYSYAWTGPSTYTSNIQNPIGLQAGVYQVTATDANGCVTSSSITLTEPAALSVNVNSPTFAGGYNISCNGYTNGSINLTNGGGIPNYSYNWSGPSSYTSSVQSPTGLTAGVYSVSIMDANACSISSTITLTEPTSLTGSITSPTVNGGYNITCNGANNAVITQTLSGGTLPYSIIWNNGLTTQDVNNIGAGSYSVIITDANNCSINQSIILTEPETVFASANSPSFYGGYNIKCNSNSTGTISLGAIGGTTPYTYNWAGPSTFTSSTQNLNNVNAGTYTATVTDINNCSFTTTITLTEPAVLASSVSSYTFVGGNNISCHGFNDGAITSTVSGGTQSYQYNWVGPLGFTSSSQNLNSLVEGSYTLTVTDTNNCVTNNTIILLEPSVLTATLNSGTFVGGYNISCNGNNDGSINVNVAGGTSSYTYLWTASNSYTSSAQNINTLYAGNYSVSVTDANNCMVNLSQILTEPTALKDTMIVSEFIGGYNLSCFNSNNGTVQLTTTGGTNPYTQVWTGPSAFTSTITSISNLAAGSYSVLITDANGCMKTETITLAQPSVISQSLSTTSYVGGVNIRCKGDSTGVVYNTINGGTPGFKYQWFGPAGFTATTEDIYDIVAGTYTVLLTDTNGCTNTSIININEPAVVLTASLNVNNVDCNGNSTGNISISVNGGSPGYNYWWRGPNNYTSFNQNLNGLYSGLYDVVVTDTNGCQIFIDTVITEPAILTHTYSAINPVCKGVANGSIDLSITGGTNPYTFNWSNGTTTEDLSSISAGTYTVMYLDAHNCSNTASITITEPEQILSIDKTVTPIKCYHDANSSIALTVNGGTAPYSYSWSNGASTQSLFNLGAGNYTVTVVDSFGCVLNDVTIISQPDSLYLTIYSPLQFNGHHVSLAGSNDGLIDLTVNGGTTPFSYIWSNGNTTEDLNNITAGFYNVIVIDTNGCKASASIILTEPFVLELPTGFSPNGDGKNDLFVIHGIESYPDNTVTIYNRWGNVVYSAANYTNDWNGNSNNGQALPDATYFVILEINKGEIVKKNYVELRR